MVTKKVNKGSWTHRNVKNDLWADQRNYWAGEIRALRLQARYPSSMPQNRGLHNTSINPKLIEGIIKRQLKGRKQISVLDSGAGYFQLASDIKRRFGKSVNVTGITLKSPFFSEKTIAESKKFSPAYEKILINARENARLVDSVKVGLVENIKRRKKFEIIFDYGGPLLYSLEKKRLFEQYAELLKPNGVIIVKAITEISKEQISQINEKLKKKGFALTMPKLIEENGNIFYVRKIQTKSA